MSETKYRVNHNKGALIKPDMELPLCLRWSRERIQHHLLKRLRPFYKRRISLLLFVLLSLFLLYSLSCNHTTPPDLPPSLLSPLSDSVEGGGGKGIKEKRSKRGVVELVKKQSDNVNNVINPHNFHLMMSNPRLCVGVDEVRLFIMVASSADHFDRRKAIRDTWGSEYLKEEGVVLAFLLANPGQDRLQRKIVEEYRTFGDTIQEDFVESYMNLTLKTIQGIKWLKTNCPQAIFVMKTDDDIYVNVPFLLNSLRGLEEKRMFFGCIKQRKSFQPVNVDPRGPGMLPPAHPPFVAGAGYIFSGSLLSSLYEASLRTRLMPVEDVYVSAHLATRVGAHPPIHDNRFTCGEMVMNDCDMKKTFTGHKVTPERMYKIWDKLNPNTVNSPCDRYR